MPAEGRTGGNDSRRRDRAPGGITKFPLEGSPGQAPDQRSSDQQASQEPPSPRGQLQGPGAEQPVIKQTVPSLFGLAGSKACSNA